MSWPKGRKKTAAHRAKIGRALRGCKHNPEGVERMRQKLLGRKPTPEEIQKNSQSMRRRWAVPGYREKMVQAFSRRGPEWREKIRQARLHRRFPKRMTSLEIILRGQFKKRRLRFEMHKTMFHRCQPDFVFEAVKLIVEADGDYWHRVRPDRKQDHLRLAEAAAEADWTVWRFAESEIRQHPEACGRAVARFVRSR